MVEYYYPQQQVDQPQQGYGTVMPSYENVEGAVTNIVSQIDPQQVIDNLDHALKGEQWNKELGKWVFSGNQLVNDSCRNAVINYLTPALTNISTMGIIDEKRLSLFMEGVIQAIRRMFVCNLELYGFVPPGEHFDKGIYYNRGTPDSSRMNMVTDMIYRTCFLVLTRSLKGIESHRIFKSLTMTDTMGYSGGMTAEGQRKGWLGRLFGRRF